MKITKAALCASFVALGASTSAYANALEIDFDLGTVGIQSSTTVNVGDHFTAGVVYTPGTSDFLFDTFKLNLSFNDAGEILGSGPAGAVTGAIAGATPPSTISRLFDLFGGVGVVPGTTMGIGPVGIPEVGYAAVSPDFGLVLITLLTSPPTVSPFLINAGVPISILTFEFTALAAGVSTIDLSGTDGIATMLTLDGNPVEAVTGLGTVTVLGEGGPAPVPEPGTLVLLGSGLLGLVGLRLRRSRV